MTDDLTDLRAAKILAADTMVVFRRARAMGLTIGEYRAYRARIRADYAKKFTSHKGMTTSLSFGILFPIVDPDAELAVTMCSRMPDDGERKAYGEAFWRKRKPGESVEPETEAVEVRDGVFAMRAKHVHVGLDGVETVE